MQGPLAARWLRWQVEALEQSLLDLEEELEGNPLSHTPPLTQTRSHDREALSREPEEALEYFGPATTQGGGTQADSPQYFGEEEPSDDEGWTGPMTKKQVDTTPGEAVEYSDEEDRRTPTPDHAAEEAEDHWWSPDYGWPAEARQYETPQLEDWTPSLEQWEAAPQAQGGKDGHWHRQVEAVWQEVAVAELMTQQRDAWAQLPGVPMDTSVGGGRVRGRMTRAEYLAAEKRDAIYSGGAVCYHCRRPGHLRAACPSRAAPRVRSSPLFGLRSVNRGGRDPRKGGNVKKQPSQDVLHGDEAEEELGLARLVSSYTLPHQNSQPGRRGRQIARSKVLSRRARDT